MDSLFLIKGLMIATIIVAIIYFVMWVIKGIFIFRGEDWEDLKDEN